MVADATPQPGAAGDDRRDPDEVIDLEVRQLGGKLVAEPLAEPSVARSAGEMAMSLWISSLRAGFQFGRTIVRSAGNTPIGRMVNEAVAGATETAVQQLGRNWNAIERSAEQSIGGVVSVVVPVVVRAVDPDALLEYIDVNAIIAAVDVNELLEGVDIDALLEQVDVNALLDRVDVDGLMARADVDALVGRVDVDALMGRVDIEALLEGVDVAGLAKRAKVGELVAESTSDVASSALDLGRRQAVGVDTVLTRTVNRLLGRDPNSTPLGPASLVEPADTADDGDPADD